MNSVNFSNITLKINNQLIYCPSVSLSTNISVSPVFDLGSVSPKDFHPSSMRSGSVTVNYVLNSSTDFLYDFCKKEPTPVSLEIGGLLVEKAYLTGYRVSARPYSAVGIDASFTFNEKVKGQVTASQETVGEKKSVTVESLIIDEVLDIKEDSLLAVEYSYSISLSPQVEIADPNSIPTVKRVANTNRVVKSKFSTYDYDLKTDLSLPEHKLRISLSNGNSYFVSGPITSEDYSVSTQEDLSRNFEIVQGTVSMLPTITSISASSGAIGSTFTVYGTNLDESIAGFIDDYLCDMKLIDDTSVTLTVPRDTFAGYVGPIKIFSYGGEVSSDTVFTVSS